MKTDIIEKTLCLYCDKVKECNYGETSESKPISQCEEFISYSAQGTEKLVSDLKVKHHGLVIAILEDVQKRYNYLPGTVLKEISKQLKVPVRDIYGVATFYKAFSLTPRGKHLISTCLGTACHIKGAETIVSEFEKQLEISVGETTPDKEFSYETVNCLGVCALAPVTVADGKYYADVKKLDVKKIIKNTLEGKDKRDIQNDREVFLLEATCPYCNKSFLSYDNLIDNYPSIEVKALFFEKYGWFRLSSLFGSMNFESEYKIPVASKVNFFCPHCQKELIASLKCRECNTTMVSMNIQNGGKLDICPVRGCSGHILKIY